jgi:AcrR family transcriptional regulator
MPTPPIALTTTGDVRQRLLGAALERFNTQGYAATSVREIVAAAGVSKPVLYYHFGSKEGLYVALMESTLAGFHAQIDLLAAAPGTARLRLLNFCRQSLVATQQHRTAVRLLFSIFYGPPQGAPPFDIEGLFERMLVTVRAMLADGVTSGEFRPLPTDEVSWGIVGMVNMVVEELISHDPPRIEADGLQIALELFLNGIAAGDAK